MKRTHTPDYKHLFEKWLEEWKEIAVHRDSPLQFCYEKALASLRLCPLPFESGKKCALVVNFGPKLCSMLDKRLEQYKAAHNIPEISPNSELSDDNEVREKVPKIDNQHVKTKQKDDVNKKSEKTIASLNISPRPYVPEVGSAAYAILITLYKKSLESTYPGFMYKKEIIAEAEDYIDCKLKNNSLHNYSGWYSMTVLVEKNFVTRKNCPAKFCLTDAGYDLAEALYKGNAKSNESNSKGSKSSESEDSKSVPSKNNLNYEENDIIELLSDDDDDNVFKEDIKVIEKSKLNVCEKEENKPLDKIKTKSTSNSDNDYDQFCKENPELVIPIKKTEQHFLFTEVIDSLSNEINNKEDFQIIIDENQKKTEVIKKRNKEAIESNQQKKNSVDDTSESFFLLPNNFDIILMVDTQETCGSKTKPKDDATISELTKSGILFEVRSLKVGDFLWIARCRLTNKELVLPYIIERKRLDDLSSSIKDGRYHEQKFRLRQSGVENVIYMIENHGSNVHGSIPLSSLLQAAANSAITDGFHVKFTKDHRDSMRYLSTMTAMLTKKYDGKELWGGPKKNLQPGLLMEFNDFNKAAVKKKNYTVKQMLIRQLLQLKGVSADKAVAIAELYPTPKILAEAFYQGDDKLLANIESGPSKRKLGPTISKTFHQLYTRYDLM